MFLLRVIIGSLHTGEQIRFLDNAGVGNGKAGPLAWDSRDFVDSLVPTCFCWL